MILGNTIFGKSFFNNTTTAPNKITDYTSITFFGNNVGINIDKIWGRNITLNKNQLESYDIGTYSPMWSPITYLLAEFNDTLDGGNVIGLTSPIIEWVIYRLENGSSKLEYIDTVPSNQFSYKDYTALRDKIYNYYLFAKTQTIMSAPLVSELVKSSYFGYFLIDVTAQKTYVFDAEVSGGDVSQNMVYSEFQNNTKYNTYSVSKKQFKSGTISAIPTQSMDRYNMETNTLTLLEELDDFIHDPYKVKYLKTRKGAIFNVFTYDYNSTPLDLAISEQPTIVSFSWKEVGKVGKEHGK